MITNENAKAWLPLVQALADGKRLQLITLAEQGIVEDAPGIDPRMFMSKDYRIKQVPRRFWVVIPPGNSTQGYAYSELPGDITGEIIEVVEVLK